MGMHALDTPVFDSNKSSTGTWTLWPSSSLIGVAGWSTTWTCVHAPRSWCRATPPPEGCAGSPEGTAPRPFVPRPRWGRLWHRARWSRCTAAATPEAVISPMVGRGQE